MPYNLMHLFSCVAKNAYLSCLVSYHSISFHYVQLVEIVLENGPNVLSIPMEVKKELLLNLHDASSTMDPPEEWEGVMPDQLLFQLASAWGIDLRQHEK
jgi:hypothetical protein